ncbi:hypothetical protein [Deinococcus pimensis]|uniref:hypothetical protein n=1 Tax=Deinococcus pimensis TaxID=309888 RepID=UPI000480421E|nr:hypothetical protein [Deinococcus pimensis]
MTHLKPSVIKIVTRAWLLAERQGDYAALRRLDLLLDRWVEAGDDEGFIHAVAEEFDWLLLVYGRNDEG